MNSFPLDCINYGINLPQNSILHPLDIVDGDIHEVVQLDIMVALVRGLTAQASKAELNPVFS